ncbi:MAG: cryptochrome/photolyase family protein [Gammaproteobacteria bacterium]|jgi:deoxyribodipyrimidine photolyase-related protein|nr:cryptochrome/photolyase family protein [Gammaproteobacteria bacterium]
MTHINSDNSYHTLRLVLGDQLNLQHSWFEQQDASVLYLLAELHQEATYVRHHIQKLCAFFAAMKAFAASIAANGHRVVYLSLDDTCGFDSLPDLIESICRQYGVTRFEYQLPDEYRLRQQLRRMELPQSVQARAFDSEHFLLPETEFERLITPGKHNRMESFYRKMRRRLNLLMDADKPLGGKWNYDDANREKLKPADLQELPEPMVFDNDVGTILQRIDEHDIDHFGERSSSLLWPVDRPQALALLDFFCQSCLPRFGRFQDAMTCQHEHRWSLYHSRLSFAMNCKILHPGEVIEAAIASFDDDKNQISIAQIEGFVRQIIGWREYVRAVYWINMPAYSELNELGATRDLPGYFWDGSTRMKCMQQALEQSLDYSYAHHIQRLMITGNFCLIAGIDPAQVDAWYLGVYVDAIEWVEMPNTRGMSQFADGGLIASKPYNASGNYINKMSDYCKHCHYDVKQKATDSACPFNSLYWDFMIRHRDRFGANPRIGMIYRNWDRQSPETRDETLVRAKWCLQHIDDL